MNVWQVCQTIQAKLIAATWPDSSTVVFDPASVRVIAQGEEINALQEGLIPPLCIISPLSGDSDPEHREEPALILRTIDIVLVAVNQGDRVGENTIMGGNRPSGTQSQGRGLLELEVELFDAIKQLGVADGILIQFAGYGEGQARRDPSDNWIGIQDYTFQVWTSVDLTYQGATYLNITGRTAEIDLSWQNPPVLGTTYRSVLVRKTGATAPTSISDGTVVSSSVGLAISSYANSGLTPGTYSYSLFITYSDYASSPADNHVSVAVSGTAIAS
jgi:hypothetical protein